MEARRKYYEYFHRANEHRRKILEQNFYSSLHHLRKFENFLNPRQKRWLERKTNGLRLDTTYSKNHDLPAGQTDASREKANPHLLPSQKESNFSQDREQSVGTIEDYKKLKGI